MLVDHLDEIDQLIWFNDTEIWPCREPKVKNMVFSVTLQKRNEGETNDGLCLLTCLKVRYRI